MKNVLFGLIALFSVVAYGADTPTLATTTTTDNTASVVVNGASTTTTTADCNSCDSLRGVRLSPWHVRRLNRIADRQEARECRDACNCNCNCKPAPNVLVEQNRRCKCNPNCNCK